MEKEKGEDKYYVLLSNWTRKMKIQCVSMTMKKRQKKCKILNLLYNESLQHRVNVRLLHALLFYQLNSLAGIEYVNFRE